MKGKRIGVHGGTTPYWRRATGAEGIIGEQEAVRLGNPKGQGSAKGVEMHRRAKAKAGQEAERRTGGLRLRQGKEQRDAPAGLRLSLRKVLHGLPHP